MTTIDATLRRAAERTREDLGPSGTNYPDIRLLLAFVEEAIAKDEARHLDRIAELERRVAQLESRTAPLRLIGQPLPQTPPPSFLYPTTICSAPAAAAVQVCPDCDIENCRHIRASAHGGGSA